MKNAVFRPSCALALMFSLTACLGTVVGAAVDVTLEVAKVPFKVAAAVIDVATDDTDKNNEEKD
jgi:hypothetical protein